MPEGVPSAARGADVIKRLLSNLSTAGQGLAELRGLYGTGHDQHGAMTGAFATVKVLYATQKPIYVI